MAPTKPSGSTAASPVWLRNLSSEIPGVHPRHPHEARVEELRKVKTLFIVQQCGLSQEQECSVY